MKRLISLLLLCLGLVYAEPVFPQVATSCIPSTTRQWCFDGTKIKTVTGVTQVLHPNGTETAPGIAIRSTNLGFYSSGVDNLDISIGGFRRMNMDTANISFTASINTAGVIGFGATLASRDVQLNRNAPDILSLARGTNTQQFFIGATDASGQLRLGTTLFANLGTPANHTYVGCSDCTIANPCAGGGTGAFAKRLNGVWICN